MTTEEKMKHSIIMKILLDLGVIAPMAFKHLEPYFELEQRKTEIECIFERQRIANMFPER